MSPVHPADLEALLSPTEATAVLVGAGVACERAVPVYVRHKPGESTLVSYEFIGLTESGPDLDRVGRGYVVWSEDPDRADDRFAKAQTLRPRSSATGLALAKVDGRTVFYGFPNDARLRKLRWFASDRKIKRSLASLAAEGDRVRSKSSVEVLRYKPERRLVSQADLRFKNAAPRSVFIRYSTARSGVLLARAANSLASAGVATPAVLATLLDGRVSVSGFVDGSTVRQTLADSSPPDPAAVADALAQMHGAPRLDTPRLTTGDSARQAVAATLAGIVALEPAAGPIADTVGQRLRSVPLVIDRVGFVHGDLHLNNVMVDRHSGRVTLIDLERAGTGPPEQDLGTLVGVAHGHRLRHGEDYVAFVDRLVDEYRRLCPVDETALGWFAAVGLIDQAALCARLLIDRSRPRVLSLLEAALELTSRVSRSERTA